MRSCVMMKSCLLTQQHRIFCKHVNPWTFCEMVRSDIRNHGVYMNWLLFINNKDHAKYQNVSHLMRGVT